MPLKIIETEKEGHRKVKTKEPKRYQGQKSDLYGTKTHKKKATGGRANFRGGGRTNLLEELGRVEAEPSNRNRRAEISRVHGELNRGYAKGGKAGTGPTPGQRIKARKAKAHEWWTGHTGTHGIYSPTIDKKLREKRPHSSPEGRMRDVKKIMADAKIAGKRRKWPGRTEKKRPGRALTPYDESTRRAKKAPGGIIRKVISKIKPKPKGKEQRFLDFIETGKAVDKHGVKVNVAKAAERLTGKPHVDHGIRKRTKHLGKGKAAGGRISRGHGGSTMQQHYLQHGYGPTKAKLRAGKPKIAKKGWA